MISAYDSMDVIRAYMVEEKMSATGVSERQAVFDVTAQMEGGSKKKKDETKEKSQRRQPVLL